MSNGLHRTTAEEQYERGLKAGRAERAKGLDADAMQRRIDFDQKMADENRSPVFAAFHRGRLVGMTEEV